MIVLPYNLPDETLISAADTGIMVWQPDKLCVVLGQSNHAETSLNCSQVMEDNCPVIKRNSGGETVLLSPETLVISIAFDTAGFQNPSQYFKRINQAIIDELNQHLDVDLVQRGISDISCDEKKILGSSIYRHRSRVLYHAVLNVAMSVDIIERYIAHPSKEPDYRKGRKHGDFVSSLAELGFKGSIVELQQSLQKALLMLDLKF